LIAGITAVLATPRAAVFALLIGGMFIHPAAMLLAKLLGRSGAPTKANPLAALALESTIWMLLMIALAFVFARFRVEWFFPAMLLVIGGRYLTFATLYGLRLYWVCGGVIALAGFALAWIQAPIAQSAFVGAGIEYGFAMLVSSRVRGERTAPG
jgi:hypothetical protein